MRPRETKEMKGRTMADSFQGGCACGAIRYECTARPVISFNCHCKDCQRFTGSAYISGVIVPTTAFRLLRGEPTYYTVRADSGGDTSRGFCAVCGSPVVTRFTSMAQIVGVPAASFDNPSGHKPAMDIFTSSAQPWDYMNPALPKFSYAPDVKP
jgi:hypothetical protein